ncbi:MAG: phosphatase PAP2 family protein [Eubacterium sp.]
MDLSILLWIQTHLRCDLLDFIFKTFTTLGDAGLIWILLAFILIIRKETRYTGLIMALSLILSVLVADIGIKNLVNRPRPFIVYPFDLIITPPHGTSFPSGHSASSFAAAWSYMLTHKNKIRYFWVALASTIAFSRLYLFVHFPTDVLMGLAIGILLAYFSRAIIDWIVNTKTWSWLPEKPLK